MSTIRRYAGRAAVAILVAGLAGWAGPVRAMTADGTVITNTVCITFSSATGRGWAVSFCVTSRPMVGNPCALVQKAVSPATQTSGGTMTYTIWVVNCGPTASAWNLVAVDPLPDNVSYDAFRGSWPGVSAGTWARYRGADGASWQAADPAAGQVAPYYLRFVLDMLGPNRSAMQTYSVVIL
jgi:uncharacterized repeat protein (TIGR01451 family)